jgi:hypothetical protein
MCLQSWLEDAHPEAYKYGTIMMKASIINRAREERLDALLEMWSIHMGCMFHSFVFFPTFFTAVRVPWSVSLNR